VGEDGKEDRENMGVGTKSDVVAKSSFHMHFVTDK
jgi:hypothetical protein